MIEYELTLVHYPPFSFHKIPTNRSEQNERVAAPPLLKKIQVFFCLDPLRPNQAAMRDFCPLQDRGCIRHYRNEARRV